MVHAWYFTNVCRVTYVQYHTCIRRRSLVHVFLQAWVELCVCMRMLTS